MTERPILFSAPLVRAILEGGNEARRFPIDDSDVARRFHAGATAKEIAAAYGCSVHPVKMSLRRLGLRRAAAPRNGVFSGNRNPSWKGGRRMRTDGYIEVWTPGGARLEHDLVMERHIGRRLRRGEVVHHIDHDKQNNAIENLLLTTRSEHIKEHHAEINAARWRKS